MFPIDPKCPTCDVSLAEGYILDNMYGEGARKPAEWVEGKPLRYWWGGLKTSGRRKLAVSSFRCPRCGLLREYAL